MPRCPHRVVFRSCLLALAALALAGPAEASTGGPLKGGWTARTADRDVDGRIDAVRIRAPARDSAATRAQIDSRNAGSVRWRRAMGGRVATVVGFTERSRPDTAALPRVSLRNASGRRMKRLKPADGARPVLLEAQVVAGGPGEAPLVVLRFSERITFRPTASGRTLRVDGARVASIRAGGTKGVLHVRLTPGAQVPAAGPTSLMRLPWLARVRDAAGNRAAGRTLRVSATAKEGKAGATTGPKPDRGGHGSRSDAEADVAADTGSGEAADLGDVVDVDSESGTWNTLANPIDPNQQLWLPFGSRSHWLQPWRAYLDTVPAARFRDAVGINFNVPPTEASAVARLLAESGFRRARVEIPWGAMSYDDPGRLRDPKAVHAKLLALKANGIRPLILLNSNHNEPAPAAFFDARITAPAIAGARHVHVDEATRQRLVPGLSGFTGPEGKAAEYIAVSVSPAGLVELSKPLPVSIPAGTYGAAVLRFAPFTPPLRRDGGAHPGFERTLRGWLEYVGAATRAVRDVLGTDDFDVEIWNELNFGADFLYADRYHDPVPSELRGEGSVEDAILRRTVAWLRDPRNGVAGVRIGDGFANQSPFPAGSTSPVGLDALDKHPYRGPVDFPGEATQNGDRPVDALGRPDGIQLLGRWYDSFTPSYRAFFPEYFLSGIQTETMVRDLSPVTTMIGEVPHGRATVPAGGSVPPQVWITETGLAPGGTTIADPPTRRRLQAKATLRSLVAFVNKGVSALYFYAVRDGDWAMVDPQSPDGGDTMTAVRRLVDAMAGPGSVSNVRALRLEAVADRHDHAQFAGDGTPAHPPLRNREVVAFFPFQADEHRFVVPAYVMTRDLSKLHRPDAPPSDPTRYDLLPETYRLTVGGLRTDRLTATATDPLTGATVPVSVVSRSGDTAVLELRLTDSPRLLVLEDG